MVEGHHEADMFAMLKLDRILRAPWAGHCLDAVPLLFPPSDGPTNGVDCNGPITKVRYTDIKMFFRRSSISSDNIPEASEHLEAYSLISPGKMKRHKDGSKCSDSGDPCAGSIPNLDFLIDRHSRLVRDDSGLK
jgi:hypothetical protein